MQKRSYCAVSLEIYMDDFAPLEIYEVLGMRPNECKINHAAPLVASYQNWREELEDYQNAHVQRLLQNASNASAESKTAGFDFADEDSVDADSADVDSVDSASTADAANIANTKYTAPSAPPGFYKIHSKNITPESFRKECERFISRIDKKHKTLQIIKEEYNAFLVLKIFAFINKKDKLALNLSAKVSQVCARLGIRIVTQIEVIG
ncbi:hypothetical protein BKN38_01365 [Helicobacter sp. CLO-3]|uniref:hypothetical protein n=1 Tax=unclassified Helicobacter TaxID=2593540 RepID=UPI000805DF7B|nr:MULTISPECIES: hypothetical protein [unclassified Helicobacter]OBV29761.1 hypothetical protein BA723_00170 [Helicobacter sp. CLO-3]OHU85214.1 hypothetical protein BKN38_01365 [Helicobacter sp. CLO-3]